MVYQLSEEINYKVSELFIKIEVLSERVSETFENSG